MSHELDRNAAGGYAFVSRVKTAWHKLGHVFSDEEMDVLGLDDLMRLSGTDFEVVKAPNIARVEIGGEVTEIAAGRESYSIVRTDRMSVIGAVGENYRVLQNREVFGVVEPLLDAGLARVETMGSLREGKQVWALVRFDTEAMLRKAREDRGPEGLKSAEKLAEEILPYGLFSTDHTGRAAARCKETAVRVVCANTYAMTFGNDAGMAIEVTHSGSVVENYRLAAAMLLSNIAGRFIESAAATERMKAKRLNAAEYKRRVLDVAAPIKHLEAKIRDGADADKTAWTVTALEKKLEVRNRIEDLWLNGKGHTGDRSAWEAYQGYVEYLDHEAPSSDRGVALFDNGTFNAKKAKVAATLMA